MDEKPVETLLEENNYTLLCESPLEIEEDETGHVFKGQHAEILVATLVHMHRMDELGNRLWISIGRLQKNWLYNDLGNWPEKEDLEKVHFNIEVMMREMDIGL